VARFGNKLWALFGLRTPGYPPDTTAEMAVWSFDLETDTWADDPIRSGPTMSLAGGYRPLAVPVFRSTGELVVLYNTTRAPERCAVVRLDTGSGSWSTPDALPVPDAAKDHYTVSACLGADGTVHCLYAEEDGNYLHAAYPSTNTFGSAEACGTQYYWTSYAIPRYLSNLVYFTEGEANKLGFCRLEYVWATGAVDVYYTEGTEGTPWTWTDTKIVDDPNYWVGMAEIYPQQAVSFCVHDGVKYAAWIMIDPHSAFATDYTLWASYSANDGSGWSAPADATQRLAESSSAAMKPATLGVQIYSLEGKFSLIFALQSGAADFNPEIYSYSVTPSAYQAWGYFGRPSSGYGGGFGQGWGFFG